MSTCACVNVTVNNTIYLNCSCNATGGAKESIVGVVLNTTNCSCKAATASTAPRSCNCSVCYKVPVTPTTPKVCNNCNCTKGLNNTLACNCTNGTASNASNNANATIVRNVTYNASQCACNNGTGSVGCVCCYTPAVPVNPVTPGCQNNVTANCTALFLTIGRISTPTGFMNCGFYARNASNQTVRLNFSYLSNSTLFVCNSTNLTANRACNACLDKIIPEVIPGGNNGSQGNSSNNSTNNQTNNATCNATFALCQN